MGRETTTNLSLFLSRTGQKSDDLVDDRRKNLPNCEGWKKKSERSLRVRRRGGSTHGSWECLESNEKNESRVSIEYGRRYQVGDMTAYSEREPSRYGAIQFERR